MDHGKCLAIDEDILTNNSVVNGSNLMKLAECEGTIAFGGEGEKLYNIRNFYTYSLDNNLTVKRTPARIFIQKYEGKINYIKTKTGREIKLTKSHPLLVNNGGQLLWVQSKDLKIGDYIAVLRKMAYNTGDIHVPKKDYLDILFRRYRLFTQKSYLQLKGKTNNFTDLDGCSIQDFDTIRIFLQQSKECFAKNCRLHPEHLRKCFKGRKKLGKIGRGKIIKYLKCVKIPEIKEKELLFSFNTIQSHRFNRFKDVDIDEDFIKFLAFFISEGTSDKRKIQLCQGIYIKLRDKVLKYLESIGLRYHQYSNKDFHINCKPFIDFLVEKFNIKTGRARESGIPDWILSLPINLKTVFLRWFFTFEGSINVNKSGQIAVIQANKHSINMLSYLLAEYGIFAHLFKTRKAAKNSKAPQKREYYGLSISGKRNIGLFLEHIGLEDKGKEKSIMNYLQTIKKRAKSSNMANPIDIHLLDRFLNLAFGGEIKNKRWYRNYLDIRKKGEATDFFLEEILKEAKDLKNTELACYTDYFEKIINGPVIFDKIIDISEIDYRGNLIDLNLSENHTFFAGWGGILCHNTTLTQALTGKWTDTHSEEVKRGITIKLGYADATFYKCPKCHSYSTNKKCLNCMEDCQPTRTVSFVDAPGHETLMATVLSGASIMDGALLVISATEQCPQPQTREHLTALDISGIRQIVVAQNKIDVVSKEDVLKNYNQIKEFVKGTVAENAPIVPISAKHGINIDVLIEAIEETIKTPKRDPGKNPKMLIARSFDINKPGESVKDLSGGIFGGSLIQGELKVGDEIEIRPGIKVKEKYQTVKTKITGLQKASKNLERAGPGGLLGVSTLLDPYLTKADSLSGAVLGLPEKLPPVLDEITLKVNLLERVIGSREELKVEPIKPGEPLMLNIGTTRTVGVVVSTGKKTIIRLKIPICADVGDRISISRQVSSRWRLVGWGQIV